MAASEFERSDGAEGRAPGRKRLGKRVRISRLYLPMVCSFIALAVFVRILDPFVVQALRLIAFDSYQRLAPEHYNPELPVRIVDIDQDSLARFGQWPWPRTLMRDLVVKLTEQKAVAVAFDVLFADPDQNSVEQVAKRLSPAQASRLDVGSEPTNDEVFAAALKESPSVLPIILTPRPTTVKFQPKAGMVILGDDARPFLTGFAGADRNLPILDAAAAGIGSINWIPSRDQVVRRVPLFFRMGDEIVPALVAEALRVAQGATTYALRASNASGQTAFGAQSGLNQVRIGDVAIPVDADGAITVRFRESTPEIYIPAWKVLSGAADPREIEGKIILVGTSTPGLLDLRATPLDAALPGVEVHAQTLEHIIAGRSLTRPDYARGVEVVVIILVGLMMALIMPRLSPTGSALLGLVMFVTLNLDGWFAYRHWDLLLDPLYPSLALLLLTAGITFYIYRQAEAQRGEIRGAFGRYLSPAVVEDIIADPTRLELGGEVRELTLMFCDVRNFTSISEGLKANELTNFINELLTPLTDVILNQRGTIDKYMGDAIMAFWNAPLTVGDHATRACRAAIAMAGKMAELNERWRAQAETSGRTFRQVRIGIGINTGDCCVGNLGSEQRFDYSAIGDEVNVTSRLEGLTKIYGLPVVVGEHTVDKSPTVAAMELDYIQVKGRTHATRIFTLVDALGSNEAQLAALRPRHEKFLAAYRGQRWDDAEMLLKECRASGCGSLDGYYAVFTERIAELRGATLPTDWDGSYTMTEK